MDNEETQKVAEVRTALFSLLDGFFQKVSEKKMMMMTMKMNQTPGLERGCAREGQ